MLWRLYRLYLISAGSNRPWLTLIELMSGRWRFRAFSDKVRPQRRLRQLSTMSQGYIISFRQVRQSLSVRPFCSTGLVRSDPKPAKTETEPEDDPGAMTRRLQSLAEEAKGIPSHFNSVPESTITDLDILKLQDRIAQASFDASYPRAQAQHDLPKTADKLTRQIAADQPWTGEESTPDAVLRMLTDVHKPLKIPARKPSLSQLPLKGPQKPVSPKSKGGRVLAAKEASQGYALLKEKFSPGFRAMPATMEGLASLAEERIQNARMRGEFNHLPGRGKPLIKDHLKESAHIDRTGTYARNWINDRVLSESDSAKTGRCTALGTGSS